MDQFKDYVSVASTANWLKQLRQLIDVRVRFCLSVQYITLILTGLFPNGETFLRLSTHLLLRYCAELMFHVGTFASSELLK